MLISKWFATVFSPSFTSSGIRAQIVEFLGLGIFFHKGFRKEFCMDTNLLNLKKSDETNPSDFPIVVCPDYDPLNLQNHGYYSHPFEYLGFRLYCLADLKTLEGGATNLRTPAIKSFCVGSGLSFIMGEDYRKLLCITRFF